MKKEFMSQRKKGLGSRAQAMVEFAIALPVLLVLLVGIIEAGRMVMMYAVVTNASRDAARYASAVGQSDGSPSYLKYKYCAGIRQAAKTSGYILGLKDSDITISYYHGTSSTAFTTCTATSGEDSSVVLNSCKDNSTCDRVKVTVQTTYKPIIKLIPLGNHTFSSAATRTILGIYALPNQ